MTSKITEEGLSQSAQIKLGVAAPSDLLITHDLDIGSTQRARLTGGETPQVQTGLGNHSPLHLRNTHNICLC